MNQTLVTNVLGKNVYLVNNQNFSFYICTPTNGKASIILNLVDNVNLISMNNNLTNVTNEVTSIYNKFNFSDLAVVTPIFDSNLLEQVKLNNNTQIFEYMDKFMGALINSAYTFLTNNNIVVDNKIKLNNNPSYNIFNKWFVERYNTRVELVDYNNAPINKFDNVSNNSLPQNDDSALASNVLDNTAVISTLDSVKNDERNVPSEPGFVSYILLGVIVAVISLIILYMLL